MPDQTLKWRGPIGINRPFPSALSVLCQQRGVYAWVYPSPPFTLPGVYFGHSSNLGRQIRSHYRHLLNGDYYVYKYETDNIYDPFLKQITDLTTYVENAKHLWQQAKDSEIYVAALPQMEIAECRQVEGILIDKGKAADKGGRIFCANARRVLEQPLAAGWTLVNEGNPIVASLVGVRAKR